ncbi:hypothetical protein JCM3766R1_003410 [Sporobolomyces carnicolor]
MSDPQISGVGHSPNFRLARKEAWIAYLVKPNYNRLNAFIKAAKATGDDYETKSAMGKTFTEYMPHTNRWFHVDSVGVIQEWFAGHTNPDKRPRTVNSIASRVARLHGTTRESWEREHNRSFFV